MPGNSPYKQAMRALGASVLAVFLFGFTSGPLRTCVSHPGHGSDPHARAVGAEGLASHHATHTTDDGPASEHAGCDCLGRCSLEQAPYLPVAAPPALALVPVAPKAIVAVSGRAVAKSDQVDVPLARPPPAVV